jgi:hypothetical protein
MSVTTRVAGETKPASSGVTPAPPAAATPFEDLMTVLFGACFVGGALSDAWAHTNIIKTLESFFTPWHALLYTGFVATAAWTFWLGYRRRAGVPRWWRDAWPAGYRLGALGAVLFLVGGVGDMIWHTIFGIESTLDAALSPTHLLLAFSATLLLTSPLRSWWAQGSSSQRAATGVASLALGTVVPMALVSFASPLTSLAPTRTYDHVMYSPSHIQAGFGLASYLVTTIVLGVPLLLAHRRRATFGTATALVGGVALFEMVQFEAPNTLAIAASAATVAAVVVDLVLVRLDVIRGVDAPLRLPIAGALFATVVWSAHLLGLRIGDDLRWPIELWAGAVVLCAVLGAVLGGLAARPALGPAAART